MKSKTARAIWRFANASLHTNAMLVAQFQKPMTAKELFDWTVDVEAAQTAQHAAFRALEIALDMEDFTDLDSPIDGPLPPEDPEQPCLHED